MTEHKELVDRLRENSRAFPQWDYGPVGGAMRDAARVIEEQAAEIARLTKERGVAVGALERVASDGVSSLDRANASIAELREALEPFVKVPRSLRPDMRCLVIDAGEGPFHFFQHDLDRARAALTHPPETGS